MLGLHTDFNFRSVVQSILLVVQPILLVTQYITSCIGGATYIISEATHTVMNKVKYSIVTADLFIVNCTDQTNKHYWNQ